MSGRLVRSSIYCVVGHTAYGNLRKVRTESLARCAIEKARVVSNIKNPREARVVLGLEGCRVGKGAVYAVLLSAFLCASGHGQVTGMFKGVLFEDWRPRCEATARNSASTDGFLAACIRAVEARVTERQPSTCVIGRSIVSDLFERRREGPSFHEMPVWQLLDSRAFYFISRMTIDADGAPNAYHPDDAGLDDLANAGAPGHWDGIVTDRDGHPMIQQESDPSPGYYISCTSLFDKTKNFADPRGYVDASSIPYIALPRELAIREGVRLGDFAFVINLRNGKSSYAIYADVGAFGEGSIALADALGVSSNARHGGQSGGILYLLFPGSGNQRPRTIAEIRDEGEKLLSHSVSLKASSSCSGTDDSSVDSGDF
jgi:hypothetical protein